MAAPDLFENLRLELRRGSLVLAVLIALRAEQYGYTLRKTLADHGLDVDENTLYPLLRRLETQGLLVSEWREENKRNKRFYQVSATGADGADGGGRGRTVAATAVTLFRRRPIDSKPLPNSPHRVAATTVPSRNDYSFQNPDKKNFLPNDSYMTHTVYSTPCATRYGRP